MFTEKKKKCSDNHSEYSSFYLPEYELPEKMLTEIENEIVKITRKSILNNLIDEVSVEELQCCGSDSHFIDKYINHLFMRPLNELKRQRLFKREVIERIRMLQRADLRRHQIMLEYAKQELLKL